MQKPPFMIRQGDVLLVAVDSLPSGASEQALDPERGLVLAEGEVTGHSHRIPHRHASGAAKAFRTEEDARFMRVTASVPLRHEEHKTRCATCKAAGDVVGEDRFVVAVARVSNDYTASGYRCGDHAVTSGAVTLAEPGVSDVPVQGYSVTLHGEYEPGELVARNVAD
jgi:hypothetical protein